MGEGIVIASCPVQPIDAKEAVQFAQAHVRAARVYTSGQAVSPRADLTATNDIDAAIAYLVTAERMLTASPQDEDCIHRPCPCPCHGDAEDPGPCISDCAWANEDYEPETADDR